MLGKSGEKAIFIAAAVFVAAASFCRRRISVDISIFEISTAAS